MATTTKQISFFYACVTLLLLTIQAMLPALLAGWGLYFLFAVVLSVGMLHGALDYEIEHNQNKKKDLLKFLAGYLFQMGVVAAVWVVAPPIALLLFLGYTAWHFGDTDLAIFRIRAKPWQVLLYGAGITGWILATHLPDTLYYLADLSVLTPTGSLLARIGLYQQELVIASAVCVAVGLLSAGQGAGWLPLWVVVLILCSTAYLPLLVGFTLYFGFWHSLHTLAVIQTDIQKSTKALLVLAAPYMGASVAGAAVLIVVLGALHLNSVLILFIFISALTLPHAGVMHRLFMRYKETH